LLSEDWIAKHREISEAANRCISLTTEAPRGSSSIIRAGAAEGIYPEQLNATAFVYAPKIKDIPAFQRRMGQKKRFDKWCEKMGYFPHSKYFEAWMAALEPDQ